MAIDIGIDLGTSSTLFYMKDTVIFDMECGL